MEHRGKKNRKGKKKKKVELSCWENESWNAMLEIEAVRQESKRKIGKVRGREGEKVTCVEKCLQLCGDAAPPTFNLTSVVGKVSLRSVKMKLDFFPLLFVR